MNWHHELIDPITLESFTIDKKTLDLNSSNSFVKVVEGIPIFDPSLNFGSHWEKNSTDNIPVSKLEEARKFLKPIVEQVNENEEPLILDAGCGDGVHLKALHEDLLNSRLYGIDISLAGLNLCKARIGDNVKLVQASVDRIPFRNDLFDIIYSYGVVAYTPDPKKTFKELVSKIKKNGLLGIWIFPRTKGLAGFLFNVIRSWCKLTGKYGTALAANSIVPFLRILPTRSKLTLKNATWRECKEIVMVNIAPSTLFFPEPELIESWFNEFNMEIIHNDESNPISIWGKKR